MRPLWVMIVATVVGAGVYGAEAIERADLKVVYLEGLPEHRPLDYREFSWLEVGDTLYPGETIITRPGDYLEFTVGEHVLVVVEENSIVIIGEVGAAGGVRPIIASVRGSVRYRFNLLDGELSPFVGTSAVVAGVRAGEFFVYAGADGSSLFLVRQGTVAVSAAGESIVLTEAKGVEVQPGGPPGESFTWLGRSVRYVDWDADRFSEFLASPTESLAKVQSDLFEIARQVKAFYQYDRMIKNRYEDALQRMAAITEPLERTTFRNETLQMIEREASISSLNYRFYALSALAVRRHVLGRMYLEMKTRFFTNLDSPIYRRFERKYFEVIGIFEELLVPYLREGDI